MPNREHSQPSYLLWMEGCEWGGALWSLLQMEVFCGGQICRYLWEAENTCMSC